MKSNRTKECKRKYIAFTVVSTIIWVGVAVFSVISMFYRLSGKFHGSNSYIALTDSFKATLIGVGTTTVIALFLSIFISNKLRTTIYMLSVIISTLIYKESAMYIIFGIWFIDEYIFRALSKHYKEKLSINKEIDLRNE